MGSTKQTPLHDLTKKLVEGEDKTRKCDHCGYELANEGVMFFYPDEEPVWCSFECAIHADNFATSDEFEEYDEDIEA